MAITVQYQPRAATVAAAGYAAGQGDYQKYLDDMRLRRYQVEQTERMQNRALENQRFLTEYGTAADLYKQKYGIAAGLYSQDDQQAASAAMQSQQLNAQANLQQQRLYADQMQTTMQLAAQQQMRERQLQFGAWQTEANLAADIYRQQAGFQNAAALQQSGMQGQLASNMLINQQQAGYRWDQAIQNVGLQDMANVNLLNRQYEQIQQQKMSLMNAFQGGVIDQAGYESGLRNLSAREAGLPYLPTPTEQLGQQFASQVFTPSAGQPGYGNSYVMTPKGWDVLDNPAQRVAAMNLKASMDLVNSQSQVLFKGFNDMVSNGADPAAAYQFAWAVAFNNGRNPQTGQLVSPPQFNAVPQGASPLGTAPR